jgi:hypothetical protein
MRFGTLHLIGSPPAETVQRSMRLFAEEVVPALTPAYA